MTSTAGNGEDPAFAIWRSGVRQVVLAEVADFLAHRCVADLGDAGVEVASDVLCGFVSGGKCLRSTFMYLGWLCGAGPDPAALRAAASLELLHAFALLQDDVMDDAPVRRGQPAAHVQFARWHGDRRLSGSSRRFGDSAAILLGDLCLVWAGQMLRESGVTAEGLARVWPRYDAMRTELAVGQFADLVNDARTLPALDAVLDVARRKSGNYTVRRPLEIGAALAGCDQHVLAMLGRYGAAVGEAFQLRDDMLGIFGSEAVTGKSCSGDLSAHKATSVVVAAHQMADATMRRQLTELMVAEDLDDGGLARWRTLIVATGAADWIEDMIADRVTIAHEHIDDRRINASVQAALANMAAVCTTRAL